jgi:small-conductance mechanosensitive channel
VLRREKLALLGAIAAFLAITLVSVRVHAQVTAPPDNNSDVLAHLNAAINWYKNLTTQVPPGQQPSDSVFQSNAQNLGEQVLRLAFQSARAQAALQSQTNPPTTPTQNAAPAASTTSDKNDSAAGNLQRYEQFESEVSQRIADDEAQINALKSKPAKSGKGNNVAEQLQALQGKLELDKASLDAVQQMKKFAENSNSGGTGLERSINELARSVPEVFATTLNSKTNTLTPTKPQPAAAANTQSGLIGQLIGLYGEMQSIRSIEQRLSENEEVQKIANDVRAPLRKQLSQTLQQGKDLASQSGVSRKQYDDLTKRFKQLSGALLPLSEETLVLDQSRSNLLQWRKSYTNESQTLLVSILTRVVLILAAVGVILALSEAWRRLTFRYIHDPRRRRQFLVMRRVVMGFFICLVVILGFASEFSSLATFAGFVTAGIAVGLQAVLLSVAAYFFVMGRYGIRVGDRISVAGVTGDVIDVGLVRFYLMEYATTGVDLYPTGRIVVFSNSVLFQAATPLFKQLPGTNYTFHEAVLPLTPSADYSALQKKLYSAVESVYQEYSQGAAWQRGALDTQLDVAIKPPIPEQRLQFADSGPELVVRYPVDLHRAPEIDDKISRALLESLAANGLASGVAGTPRIRTAIKA